MAGRSPGRRKTGDDDEWGRGTGVLVASVAGIMLSTVHGYSLGVMVGPLQQEFGWTRAAIASGMLILSISALFLTPLVGFAVDRLGPRRIALVGATMFCCALAGLSRASASLASWWGLWALLSVAAILVAPLVWATAINGVFERNRGLALAIALCGTGLGGAIVPSLTNQLVIRYGWRGGYVGLAIVSAAVVLPLTLLFFRGVNDGGGARADPIKSIVVGAPIPGVEIREGLHSPAFLKLAVASIVVALGTGCVTANVVPILVSRGFDRTVAAGLAGFIGIGAIAGRLACGYLIDRMNAGIVAGCCMLIPIATAALLLAYPTSAQAAGAAFLLLGLSLGAELDSSAYLAARHFGLRRFGTLFGVINGLLLFGSGLAPVTAGYIFDVTGTYTPVLWALIPCAVAASVLFSTLGRYPEFEAAYDAEPALQGVP